MTESDSNLEAENAVNFEVEEHATKPESDDEKGFGASLRRAASRVGLFDDSDDPGKEKRTKKNSKANQEEFNTLVIAVMTLCVSLANFPEQIKPNESEIGAFSNHLSGILIRHLPIAKGLSADALDIIGLFAVISGYYARIAPEVKALREPEKQKAQAVAQRQARPVDPVQAKSAATAAFLDAAETKRPVEES